MKKLILAAILFSTATFAQTLILPQCRDGKLYYMNQQHVASDFCIIQLKALSPAHCEILIQMHGQDKIEHEYKTYLKNRTEEICKGK